MGGAQFAKRRITATPSGKTRIPGCEPEGEVGVLQKEGNPELEPSEEVI